MFYTFYQNNSGGSFIRDDKISNFVIIEAPTADVANTKAEEIGIYFNGCADDMDCDCCGDRWHPVDEYDATDQPMMYQTSADRYDDMFTKRGQVYCHIYYENGQKHSLVRGEV